MNLKHVALQTTAIMIGVGLALIGGELLVRFASPQPYMHPRYRFFEQDGVPFKEKCCIH
jgi:hypothetical protein